ncbi:hypothetical protein PoB_002472100 [Plakobranchus ocellatus]|uniref:Secreted protein n=1 Tax=Plakobranchus ocellatus TaxID=259542 RepID=A0AAV3ZUN3_9GAST|nr:hypothetical protein PoB_002472100 [Plakobranchus ocellatus]
MKAINRLGFSILSRTILVGVGAKQGQPCSTLWLVESTILPHHQRVKTLRIKLCKPPNTNRKAAFCLIYPKMFACQFNSEISIILRVGHMKLVLRDCSGGFAYSQYVRN